MPVTAIVGDVRWPAAPSEYRCGDAPVTMAPAATAVCPISPTPVEETPVEDQRMRKGTVDTRERGKPEAFA